MSQRAELCAALICTAVFTGLAVAQTPTPTDTPKANAKAATTPDAATAKDVETDPAPVRGPYIKPLPDSYRKPHTRPGGPPLGMRGRPDVKLKQSPDAKWACDKTTVELEPVWRGDNKLTFDFEIRNEGTGDLKIRAKGG